MMPLLLRFLPHLAIAAALLAGAFWLRHSGVEAGRAEVQARWDRAVVEAAARARAKEERDREASDRIQNELRDRLAASDARAAALARRLREHASRPRVPVPAGPAPEPDGPGRVPDDGGAAGSRVDEALADHLAACGRDAARLDGWREWWSGVSR